MSDYTQYDRPDRDEKQADYELSVRFSVEGDGDHISAIEELTDKFAAQLADLPKSGWRSSYGPVITTSAILTTRRLDANQ